MPVASHVLSFVLLGAPARRLIQAFLYLDRRSTPDRTAVPVWPSARSFYVLDALHGYGFVRLDPVGGLGAASEKQED